MTLSPQWARDAAVRDIRVRCGSQHNCGGIAGALVDFEPHSAFEFVRQLRPDSFPGYGEDQELADSCSQAFEEGVRAELLDVFGGTLPPLRVVLRWILLHPIDSVSYRNREAGRLAVSEAIRRARARHVALVDE